MARKIKPSGRVQSVQGAAKTLAKNKKKKADMLKAASAPVRKKKK